MNRFLLALAFILTGAVAGGLGVLVGLSVDRQHSSCCDHDHAQMHAQPRSPHWPAVRKAHLAREPACAACGSKKDVEVHHCVPFHLDPSLETEPTNLITLCHRDHFLVGHLCSYYSFNKDVRQDAAVWRKKIKERP